MKIEGENMLNWETQFKMEWCKTCVNWPYGSEKRSCNGCIKWKHVGTDDKPKGYQVMN